MPRRRPATRQGSEEWIELLVSRVAGHRERRGEPRLTSRCARSDLFVVDDSAAPCRTSGRRRESRQAAEDRLECYRSHGAELPADGDRPQLAPRTSMRPAVRELKSARQRTAVASRRATASGGMREVTCTSRFMMVPAAKCRECGAALWQTEARRVDVASPCTSRRARRRFEAPMCVAAPVVA